MPRRDFGRYKIVEEVGRGAMGVVYRATDPLVGRTVAIKAINQGYLEGVGVKATEYLERFRREAEVAGRLDHPNIVKIFDLGPDYLVMEFVEGQSLASLVRGHARMKPDHILQVVAEVASALDYAHARGVVHRDVKPGNVMVAPDGRSKVMDFGLARVESSTLTAAGEVLGSAAYMAPEAVLGEPADARSDIFGLGVVAYEMMTGDRPFSGTSITLIIQNIVHAKPRSARALNLHLPPEYDAIFERVLAKKPEERYETASAFASALALRTWAEPELPTPAAIPPAPVAAKWSHTIPIGSQTIPIDPRMLAAARSADDDAPLASLLDGVGPSTTLPPGTTLPPLPRDVASRRVGPSDVLPPAGEPVRLSALPTPATPKRRAGVSLGALVLAAGVVGLALLAGAGVFVYRMLRRPRLPEVATSPTSAAPAKLRPSATPSRVIAADRPTPAPTATPKPVVVPATLTVSSEPGGARVTIGGVARGTTPARIELPPGKIGVSVEKDGFKPWRRDVILFSRGLSLDARLERASAPELAPTPTPRPAPTPTPRVKTGDLVPMGPDVTAPKKLSGSSPRVRSGQPLTGSVVVEFVVDEDGRIREPHVVEPAGNALDAACLEAVRDWRYEPAASQGVKVRVVQRAKFTFRN